MPTTLEEAKKLADKRAKEIGLDIADFVTYDKDFGFVFQYLLKGDMSSTPMPTGIPYLESFKDDKFSPIKGRQLIFHLLRLKGGQ